MQEGVILERCLLINPAVEMGFKMLWNVKSQRGIIKSSQMEESENICQYHVLARM